MKLMLFISILVSSLIAGAAIAPIPTNAVPSSFRKTVTTKINQLIALPSATDYDAEGIAAQRVARFEYDTATDGGSIGAHGLGVTLPAKSIITRSFFYIQSQFADSASGTVALSCEDANNIKTATDITGSSAGAIIEGESTGAASAFKASIAADCEITATVADSAQSSGKLTGWVTYVVHE